MCHRGQISGVPGFGCGLADEGPDNGGSVASAQGNAMHEIGRQIAVVAPAIGT